MVDVKEIAARARDLEPANELIGRFMELPCAQAVTARVMPWLLLNDEDYLALRYYYRFVERVAGHLRILDDWWIGGSFNMADRKLADLDWDAVLDRFRDGDIGQDIARKSLRGPLQFELHVRQDAYDEGQAKIVRGLANETPLFVTVARRGAMQFQLAGGDRILSGSKSGTIGGFIADAQGTVFGLTCSHVGSTGTVTDVSGTPVGKIIVSTAQTPMVTGSVCHPNPRPGSIACAVNSLDLALIEMSVAVAGTGLTVTGSVAQGDTVDVDANGARYRFGVRSVAIAMQLGLGGISFCYSPMIELHSPAGTTWPSDSGAWGLTRQFSEWGAVVVGADSVSSFAMDARDASAWIDTCIGANTWSVH